MKTRYKITGTVFGIVAIVMVVMNAGTTCIFVGEGSPKGWLGSDNGCGPWITYEIQNFFGIFWHIIPQAFAEEEILILVENEVRKVYYTGENIVSVVADPVSASVIFETGKNAKLEVKAPKVYKVSPDLFILRNGEEVDAVTDSDECFFYATIETQEPEKIEIIFAFWPEYPETVENCETFEEEWPTEEFTDEEICGVGNVLDDGICVPSGSRADDFRDASGEIICKGYTSGGGFLEYPECGPIDQFVIHVLVIVLPVAGIIAGIVVVWRKRK